MDIVKTLLGFLVSLLGLAPKVIDAAKDGEDLGPPPPADDKEELLKKLEAERAQKFGPK